MDYNHQYQNDGYYNNNNWDSRSAKSYNTQHSNYSSQHLNPQYNNAPPVPQLHFAQPVVDYPPMQQPKQPFGGAYDRAGSIASGYTSARDKLMKRRVSADSYSHFRFRGDVHCLPALSLPMCMVPKVVVLTSPAFLVRPSSRAPEW
jgi:hypothetical protein